MEGILGNELGGSCGKSERISHNCNKSRTGDKMRESNILKMQKINKSFSGVRVLHDVDFVVKQGEIRALVGENGAGKSTLMKILCGIYEKDSGSIMMDGVDIKNYSIPEAARQGIVMIHQEIVLVQDLPISENIFMGSEPKTLLQTVDFSEMRKKTKDLLAQLDMEQVSPDTLVRELSISQQQMVEIARALSKRARVIIMDEPTSSLTEKEVNLLFRQIRRLKNQGVAIIYISHRMDEIFEIADSVTIMRDGQHIKTEDIKGVTYSEIIKNMVGREISEYYPPHIEKVGQEILRLSDVSNEKIHHVDLTLHKGEILGLAGLVGAGRTELANAIFGIDEIQSGEISYQGKKYVGKSPRDAIRNGMALVPEDRKRNGLFLENTIAFNMTIAIMDRFIKFIHQDKKKEQSIVDDFIDKLSIKMAGQEQLAVELSGGNQQKVIFSKWLATQPKILILDEPTRGIDVGAKMEIYHLMNEIAASGVAIILISSELSEVINLSTRLGVMCEGRLTKIFDLQKETVSQEMVMHYATGGYADVS
ncbi:sugar ABC transporter ATP-binding protein [Bariatricus massiliensis]|uniref:Sugar ABC transporter ATP-binding protein n=1 Tax=Bariatricus massiliensis TaxID=1745713 RepID=A0ABS8DE74_9FIRM|nr:sugar ABC transporter ATP-binding protein [Bariatricus massiliensis]MCB7302807.1 sugar ABC transporter ATP-binding protein [Bariatricus massiliensis]MCB7374023.1 sugar ABC transporter ATP-binding protein [Bariatricus massiliensis]MCB7386693.1 sugar ABC transporter ATP-binding protein [Bariatricus massiliensis]MCB7410855.1 sugar ABC transporter ATP-binding protein [Bariatricus massiliensis]MCQ5251679.1 sugar ABC transporter ATP-binding protein [Bariatricus massiliensis]